MTDLSDTAQQLLTPGKGILAADESTASADKRLTEYGIAPSAEMRRQYRDLFLATPGIEAYLSGVILYQENALTKLRRGRAFCERVTSHGIIPGIKVDEGTEPMQESPEELITKGLLGLRNDCRHFVKSIAPGFTKWRAIIE